MEWLLLNNCRDYYMLYRYINREGLYEVIDNKIRELALQKTTILWIPLRLPRLSMRISP
jgi:hypothetical protein